MCKLLVTADRARNIGNPVSKKPINFRVPVFLVHAGADGAQESGGGDDDGEGGGTSGGDQGSQVGQGPGPAGRRAAGTHY